MSRRADRQRAAVEAAMLADGKYLRIAAMSQDDGSVHVIFRGEAGEVGYFMSKEAYAAFPLLAPVTPDDYAKHGPLAPAPTEFYYATVSRCSGCGEPAHASETDDLDRCEACAAAAGEPHAEVES